MKSIFSLTLVSSALCSLAQADFYVASSGSDSNAGTFAEPFASIQHAVDQSAANDTIFIRGGTYREEVNLRNHSDLLLTAYNEETVIISGCDLVSSEWTPAAHDANIQQTPFVSDDVMQLFIAGERMNLARYPDEDAEQNMFSFSEWTDTLTERQVAGVGQNRVLFRDWEDGQFPDDHWAGGFYSGRNGENPFSAASGKIGSSSGRYLHVFEKNFFWEREAGTGNSCIGDGVGYIINHLNALSISTEWYWDADSDTLYCYPPTGTSLAESSVEARVRLWGADLSGAENVRVEGIDFFASSIKMEESQSCTISNCRVKYPAPWTDEFYGTTNHDYGDVIDGSTGIFVSGSNNVVDSCYIGQSWCGGIRLEGEHNTISNSFIEDIDWLFRRMQPIQIFGDHNSAIGNTVQDSAQSGIDCGNRGIVFKAGTNATVTHNIIRNATRVSVDSGALYINFQGTSVPANLEFAYNIIDNVIRSPHGIYLDNGTSNVLIHHNVIRDPGNNGVFAAARAGDEHDVYVYNNTVWGGQIRCFINGGNPADIVFRNNLCDDTIQGGTTMNRNIANANPSSVVVDFAGGDDTLQADFTSAIDQGAIIAGITDGFVGSAPDLGAYELGVEPWHAGVPLLIVQEEEMPDASVGAAYQASLSASGGIKPYTWAVVEDTLPNGLSISASGEISGTPTSEALYQTQSVIEVTDYVGTTTRVIVPFTTNQGVLVINKLLLGYDFDSDSSDPSEPTLIDPKLSASRLSSPMDIHFPAVGDISGLDALGSQLGTPNIRGSIGIGVNDATTTSFERAVAGNDYLSFTVTPNDGQSLHLSAITFKATKRDIVSVDEYALADDSGRLIQSSVIVPNVIGLSGIYDGFSIDLAGTAFETITEATTFRLYAWGRSTDTTSATLSTVDKLTLYGRSAAESAYLEWVLDHGLTGDDTLPNSDIENNGRGDGYSNFLEFALNMNPSQADAGSQEAAFTELAGENPLFVYQYHRRTDHAALDLNYLLRQSSDLINPVEGQAFDTIIGDSLDGYESILTRFPIDAQKRFFQLLVE